jgi:hypothetical protein
MALSGKLTEIPLFELLEVLVRHRRSGHLRLRIPATERDGADDDYIHTDFILKRGRLIHAESQADRRPLGALLVERGLLTDEQLTADLVDFNERDDYEHFGEYLVGEGLLGSEEVTDILADQLAGLVYRAATEPEGDYNYQLAFTPPDPTALVINIGLDELIIRGLVHNENLPNIKDRFWSFRQVPNLTQSAGELYEMDLPDNYWTFLSLVNGRRNLEEMVLAGRLAYLEMVRIAIDLVGRGHLDLRTRPLPAKMLKTPMIKTPELPPETVKLIREVLHREDDEG